MEIERVNNYMLFDSHFVSSTDNSVYTNVKFRMAFYVNLVKFYINNKSIEQAEKALGNIITLVRYNEYPPFLLNIFIYFYLVQENFESALKIIKTRSLHQIKLPV
jgi:hypothetical protein